MAEQPKRARALVRQRDMKSVIKAVRAAGERIAEVEVGPDGKIRIILAGGIVAGTKNPWDAED